MSSYFVYNTNGTYTRDDLEKLSFVTHISKKIRKNSSSEMDMNDFPQLVWICRDYKFEIKNEKAGCDALRKFMKTNFDSEYLNKTKDCFINSFKKIDGFYLPFPDLEHPNGLSSKKLLLAIENYKWDDFSGEFYEEMNKLCQKIKQNVQIKMFNEKKLKGNIFSEFIKKVVENLNDDKTILVVDMVEVLIKIECNRNLDEIKRKYSDKLNEVFYKLPMKWELMNSIEEKARKECLDELKKKIEWAYFKEYEDIFMSFSLNKKDNSGIFSDYLKKNRNMIEKICNDEFQNLDTKYKNRMNEKLYSLNFIEDFESFENNLGYKLFGEFKEKVKDFCTNKSESIISLKLYEEKFKNSRETLDFRKKFLEKYLEKEWNSIKHECEKHTMSQYESSVSNFETKYRNLEINEPEKSKCWNYFYLKNYQSIKTLVKNKIDYENNRKEEERLKNEKIKREKEHNKSRSNVLINHTYPIYNDYNLSNQSINSDGKELQKHNGKN